MSWNIGQEYVWWANPTSEPICDFTLQSAKPVACKIIFPWQRGKMVPLLIMAKSSDCVGEATFMTRKRNESFNNSELWVFNCLVQKLCQMTVCSLEKCYGWILLHSLQLFLLQGRAQVSRQLSRCYSEINQLLLQAITALKHIYTCVYIYIYTHTCTSQHLRIYLETSTDWIHIQSHNKHSPKASPVWFPYMRNLGYHGKKVKNIWNIYMKYSKDIWCIWQAKYKPPCSPSWKASHAGSWIVTRHY